MNRDEYEKLIKDIEENYRISKKNAIRRYALSNSNIKIGDTFTDHIGSIEVEQISVYLSEKQPSLIYHGVRLKKNGDKFKSGEKRAAHQINERPKK